jgi:uncharacterized membrane protein (UPF0182 family)
MPELRLVVLALQDKLAYGPTFEAALSSLFGGGISSLSAAESPTAPAASTTMPAAAGTPAPAQDMNSLIKEAGKDFDDYQRLTAAGKLGEAGQKLEALKLVLGKLSARAK